MSLLDVPLPELRLKIDIGAEAFFDRCEGIARTKGWSIDRRRQYAGPGYDQLNVHLGSNAEAYPMLRMVATPREPSRLRLDVIDHWKSWPIDYDEYLTTARVAYGKLLAELRATGSTYRLGIPRRPTAVDYSTLDCSRISYAAEKFSGLPRTFAVGPGDARDRLINAFSVFHVVRPEHLPEPLRGHLAWVYSAISERPARHQWEGSVEATVRTMKNSTASGIIERILDIGAAVDQLYEYCMSTKGAV